MPEPTRPGAKRIALPSDFPITWSGDSMAMATWSTDPMHTPAPVTPMTGWFRACFAEGWSRAMASHGTPLRMRTTRINTYAYSSVQPTIPPAEIAEASARADAQVFAAAASMWDRWVTEWLPGLQRRWAEWAERDIRGSSDEELLSHIEGATALITDVWDIHFQLMRPVLTGSSSFVDLFAELFPAASALEPYKLLQGFDNLSLESGRQLWALSRTIKADYQLNELFGTTPTSQLLDALSESESGRAVLARLRDWLAFFGKRSDTVFEVADASWIEDPTPAISNLKAYLPQDEDPDAHRQHLADERDAAVAAARVAISNYPPAVRAQFDSSLATAQRSTARQEDHNVWIDQRSLHEARQLCLEVGRRLADRGLLEKPTDVFMLDMEEAKALLAGSVSVPFTLAAERAAEMNRWRRVTPPSEVGTDYGRPPPSASGRAQGRLFGVPPSPTDIANEIRGTAGSPGKVMGVARIALTIAEAGRLQAGEILVAPTTAPPWTPFFATAAAVVTEAGGVLSHCAIVAREYAIPAVVGAAGATSVLLPN